MALFENRRYRELRTITFQATAASIDSNIYIADKPTIVKQVQFALATQGAASSTLDIKKCTGTTVPASGTTVLSSAFALDSTINTVTTRTLSSTTSSLYLQPGDRLAVDLTGTLTGLSCLVQLVVETI
jgi:hypothetical protein